MKPRILIILCPVLIGLLSGCVTGRRSFDLAIPAASSYPQSASLGPIAIGEIRDLRQFQNHPDSPDTPSIDGDVTLLSDQARSKFIGRQRSGFGKAFGDVVLPAGGSVQEKIAALLREGLKRRGYSIADPAATENTVSVDINQFWGWMTPGIVALSFEADIRCRVTVTRGGKRVTFRVRGYGLNHGQFAKDVNWQEAYDIAFNDFLNNLDDQLANAGF